MDSKTYPSISLKLFSYGINSLHDPQWTGTTLYYEIKRHVQGREKTIDLLYKTLERGVSYYIGKLIFSEYFSLSYFCDLSGEYKIWFIEDFIEMLKFHEFPSSTELDNLEQIVKYVNGLYDEDEDEYYLFLDSEEASEKLYKLFDKSSEFYKMFIDKIAIQYYEEFSDRILHDRQLCYYISKLLFDIGFDGSWIDEIPKQWVERERWPERVKKILNSRDRGKCASCHSDFAVELDGEMHIDHMIPVSKGGCNDLVNLQLLCDDCNLKKSNNNVEICSSIPKYIRRKKRKKT